jgi:hypothetical protein
VKVFRALRVRIVVGKSFISSLIVFVRGIHFAMNPMRGGKPARFTAIISENIFLVFRFFISVLDRTFLFSMGKIINITDVQYRVE